jgi:Trypsin
MMRIGSLALAAVLVSGAPMRPAPAIIRRADRADSLYLAAGARYPAVIALGRLGDATLIAPEWLLTAGHIGNAMQRGRGPAAILIAGAEYHAARIVVHPDWRELGPNDVALIRLDRAVSGIAPLPLYRGDDEPGRIATLVGHGASGVGTDRVRGDDGRARGATSEVDSVDAHWLYFSFDAPPGGTELEGAPGAGDSGGPAIILVNGAEMVAGVSSAGYDGRDGPGTYGAVDVFTRTSRILAWIDGVMKTNVADR